MESATLTCHHRLAPLKYLVSSRIAFKYVHIKRFHMGEISEQLLGIVPIKRQTHAAERLKSEQALEEKFGEEGMKAYVKIDGKRNAEEIRAELSMDEQKFLELLNYLEDCKLIITKTVFELELEKDENE